MAKKFLRPLKPLDTQGLPAPIQQASPSEQYAQGYIAGSSLQDYIAASQGKWDELGNAAVQVASEAVLGTLEATSYLADFKQHIDWLKGQEQEYTNAFAEAMKSAKETLRETNPIYQSQQNEGFEPTNFEWWAHHSPSVIGTAASLLIPAAGVAKLGQVAKLGKVGQTVSATIASRLAESTMEASQVFERSYADLLGKGLNDKEARERAGKEATHVWNTNWLFAASDFFQLHSLMKGFDSAIKGVKGTVIGQVAKQAVSESLEEAGQYISAEEGFKAATQGTDFFGKGFSERLYDYIQADEFKTSAMLGAMGGAVFTGMGPLGKATQAGVGKGIEWFKQTITQTAKDSMAKEKANSIGDIATSTALSDKEFNTQLFRKLQTGDVLKYKIELEDSLKDPAVSSESKALVKDYIDDLDFVNEEDAKLKNSSIPQQHHNQVLAGKLEVRQLSRLQDKLKQDINKTEQETVKTGGLDQNILQLKQLQLSANAYTRLAKDNPRFTEYANKLNAAFQEQLNADNIKLAFTDPLKALHTTQDETLNQKYFQSASIHEKLKDAKDDLYKLTTPEGRKQAVETAKVRQQEAAVQQQLDNPATTKEQLQEAKAKVQNPELLTKIDTKIAEQKQVAKETNLEDIQQTLNIEVPPAVEELPEDINPEEIDPDQFEQAVPDEVFPEDFEDIVPEVVEEEPTFASLLQKQIEAELPKEEKPLPEKEAKKVKRIKSEAVKQSSVTAWGKEVETELYQGEKRTKKDSQNNPIPQTYYDKDGNEVKVTDVFATNRYDILLTNTPEVKVGDPILLKLVDNGGSLQAPFSFTRGFRPTGQHNYVIWVYRILPDGTIEDKPLKELPSLDSPSDTNNKDVLAKLRKQVIEQGELRTTIADSTSYGEPRTGSKKTIDVFETDYIQDDSGTWDYFYTPYKPIIAFTGIGNKITVPNMQQSWPKHVIDRVDEAVNTVDHPGNRAPGSIYALRTNQKGNFRFVTLSKRQLNEAEKGWVKSNLHLLTQGKVENMSDVMYVEDASIGLISTKHGAKKPDLIKKSRSRIYVLNGPKPKIAIPLPSHNFALLDFGAFNNYVQGKDFVYEVMGALTGERKNVSTYDKVEAKQLIEQGIDNVLENSTRNLPERHLNNLEAYSDPVTNVSYNSFYDFLVQTQSLTAEVPGIKGLGHGQDNAYSFHLTGLYISLPENIQVVAPQGKVEDIKEVVEEPTKSEVTPELSPVDKRRQVLQSLGSEKLREHTPATNFKTVTERELNWFTNKFGKDALSLAKDVDRIISKGGLEAYGIYHNALVQLAQFAEEGTAYHEAMHFILDPQLGLVSENRREKILDAGAKEYGIKRSYNKSNQPKLRAVDYQLKAIELLQSPKADEIFRKGDKNNWSLEKILNELQISKEQKELILDIAATVPKERSKFEQDDFGEYNEYKSKTNLREELITSLLTNYSYTIEVNTAKGNLTNPYDPEQYDNAYEEYDLEPEERHKRLIENTQFYSNLTVPGGTNYTENEIATPAIIPSIKGHAQFSTDKGIGWFRSDEQVDKDRLKQFKSDTKDGGISKELTIGSKTRRVLEIQSDLFQKGRDKKDLTKDSTYFVEGVGEMQSLKENDFDEKGNQFLQLLNKDNNWVTFFIKSIIQDSAKKGYEKVLFPTGNTASKVEGHATLEEFKKQKEDRLGQIDWALKQENAIKEKLKLLKDYEYLSGVSVKDVRKQNPIKIENLEKEQKQLKQELERVEKEGFAALAPIYKFYEETVGNILKKNYKTSRIKDEFSNEWIQIDLTKEQEKQIKLKALNQEAYKGLTGDGLIEEQLAESFRDYMLTGKLPVKPARTLFARIWAAIKNLLGFKTEIQKLFKDIEGFESTPEQRDLFEKARKGELSEIEEKYRLLPGFISQLEQEKAVQYVAGKFMNYLWNTAKKFNLPVEEVLNSPTMRSRIQDIGGEGKSMSDFLFEKIRQNLLSDFNRINSIPANQRTDIDTVRYYNYWSMGVPLSQPITQDDIIAGGYWNDRIEDINQTTGFQTEVVKYLAREVGLQLSQTEGNLKYEYEEGDTNEDESQLLTDPDDIESEKVEDVHGIDSSLKDPAKGITQTLKLFLSTIPDEQNRSVFGSLPVRPTKVIQQLKGRLANTRTPLVRLEELSKQDNLMKLVYDKISQEVANGNTNLVDEFNTRFILTSTNYKTVREVFRNGVMNGEFINSNRTSTVYALMEKWKEGFQGPILDKEGNPQRAHITVLNNRIKQSVEGLKNVSKQQRLEELKKLFSNTLKSMNIELPKQVWERVEERTKGRRNEVDLQIGQLENWLITPGKDTISSLLESMLVDNFNLNRKSILDRLADLSKDYVTEVNEGVAFLGEDGNLRYGVNLPSAASDLYNDMINDPETEANYLLQDKFYQENKIITEILQKPENLASFKRDEILAYRKGDGDAKDFEDRTTQESLISRLTAFVNNGSDKFGYFYFGTHEAKQKQTLYQLPKKGTTEALKFLKSVLQGTIQAESSRIQRVRENPTFEPFKSYQQDATRFLYIPELNTIEGLADKITDGTASSKELQTKQVKVNEVLDKFIADQYKGFEDYIVSLGLVKRVGGTVVNETAGIPEGLVGGSLETFLQNFFYNDFAWRFELSKLFNGDLAQYKNTEDYFKRNYQTVTPGTKPFNDPTSPVTFRVAIHKAMPKESPIYGLIKDSADSQTWMMPSAYREVAKRLGQWSKDHEDIYDFAWKYHKTLSQALREKATSPQEAETYREALKKANTPPLKPFQFSDIVTTLPNGEKVILKEQIKDSRVVLNPEFALRNKNFKQLYNWMLENKLDIIANESGTKLARYGLVDTSTSIAPEQARIHNLSDLRLPQLNNDKDKDEVSGSQKHKLILGDINRKNNYKLPSGKVITGQELIEQHQEAWAEIHSRDSQALKKKLGFNKDFKLSNDKKERFKQLKGIKDRLERALSTKDASENYFDALRLIKDKLNNVKFVSSLAFPQNASIFESTLINLFKKSFLNPKTPGFMGVNMADFVSGFSTNSNLQFVKNEKGVITEAEIGMPVEFFQKIGLNFTEEFVDRATNKVKWDKLTENQQKALQGILYRIPTSNKSSMTPVRIVAIIPRSQGNVIMLPPEMLSQQGLDFDYDKSQVALRTLDKDGNVDESAENKLFDLEWAVLTSNHHYEEMLRPLTSNHLEALAAPYKAAASILSPMNTARDLMAEEQNKDAKTMIGIYSRGNTAHAVLQTIEPYVTVNSDFGFPVSAKNGEFVKLGKTLDNAGRPISENFAEYQAGALDAGNKPILYYIATNVTTSPVVVKLLLQGVTPKIIVNFLKQPVITEWLTAYQKEQTVNGATEHVFDKFKGLQGKINQLKDKQIIVELTEGNLESKLTVPIEHNLDYSARVLEVFLDELRKSSIVRNLTDVLSIDTFSDMSSVASVKAMGAKAASLMYNPEVEKPISIDDRVFQYKAAPKEAKRIASFFKHGLEDALELASNFFPYHTGPYADSITALGSSVGQLITNKRTIKNLQQFLNFHIFHTRGNNILAVLNKLAPNRQERWDFFDVPKSIWNRIQLLKTAKDSADKLVYPEITNNFFIQSIRKVASRKGDVQMIGINNNSGAIDRNSLIKAWRDLMLSPNQVVKELSYDLVRYAIYTSGFGFNINSFVNLIPMDFFIEEGLTESHYDVLESLETTQINNAGAVRSFIRHTYPTIQEVPQLYVSVKPQINEVTGQVAGYRLTANNLVKPQFVQATGELLAFTIPMDSKLRAGNRLATFIKINTPTYLGGQRVNNWNLYEANPNNPAEFRKVQNLGRNLWETTETGDNESLVPINKAYPHANPWQEQAKKEVKQQTEEGSEQTPDCLNK